MMFSQNESFSIETAKREIKGYINARSLLWNGLTRNVVIAGGFFTSVMQNKPFKDIDIFVLNNDVDVYNHLTEGFHNAVGTQQLTMNEKGEWRRSEMMAYMHNTNILDVINNTRTNAQYILTRYQTREELLAHFDYKHCKVSYVPEEDKLYLNRETYDCIQNKILKVNNISNSKNHQYRLTNFLDKGWVLETVNDEYSGLRGLTSDMIKDSYQTLKEQMAAKMLDAYGLPPMQQQAQGFIAQTVDEILQTK